MFLVVFLAVWTSIVEGGELVVENVGVEARETFNAFRGSLETLASGWIVSSNDSGVMCADSGFRGVSTGAVTSGGCYAWDLGGGDYCLGYQPTAGEFTPGCFMVTVSNATGLAVGELSVSFEILCRNDQDRSSSLDVDLSLDGASFSGIQELKFGSPEKRDAGATWRSTVRLCRMVLAQPVPPDGRLWLRWRGDDLAGSGSRDEIGIDNLRLVFHYTSGTVICIQ